MGRERESTVLGTFNATLAIVLQESLSSKCVKCIVSILTGENETQKDLE